MGFLRRRKPFRYKPCNIIQTIAIIHSRELTCADLILRWHTNMSNVTIPQGREDRNNSNIGWPPRLFQTTLSWKRNESGCSSYLQSLSCKSPARHARHCSADGEMLEIPSKALRAANSPACCPWCGLHKRVNWYSVAMDKRSRHLSIFASTWMETCTLSCQSHVIPDLFISFGFVCDSMINIDDRMHKPNCGWGAILSLAATTGQDKFWHFNKFKLHHLANLPGNPGPNETPKLLLNKQSGVTPAKIESSKPAMWRGNKKWKGSRKGSSLSWCISATENALQVQIQVVWYHDIY